MKAAQSHQKKVLKQLQEIPGVGPSIAADLYGIGIRAVSDLADNDPEKLYTRICRQQGYVLDHCLLYVMRCAVYYATESEPNPELLKWWNWKDTKKPDL